MALRGSTRLVVGEIYTAIISVRSCCHLFLLQEVYSFDHPSSLVVQRVGCNPAPILGAGLSGCDAVIVAEGELQLMWICRYSQSVLSIMYEYHMPQVRS